MARGDVLVDSRNLVVEECCNCGIVFAMPEAFKDECRRKPGIGTGKGFYCPNGHQQWYAGKTDAQIEREKREKAERDVTFLRSRLDQERAELANTKNRLRAEKAAKTRARNRADRGVCQHCRRSFENVKRHVETCHPEALATTST